MIQLPYRENMKTVNALGEEIEYSQRIPGANGETIIVDMATSPKKRNTKSYKSELKAMTKERDKWRKACKWCVICFLGYIAIDILYAIFG